MRRNYYHIWPKAPLELKHTITSAARNAAATTNGMVELRSIVFYPREERGRWRQGPRCLRCSKIRRIGSLGGLRMTLPRRSGRVACIPELTTRRYHGRLLCLGSRAKASILKGGIDVSSAIPHSIRHFFELLSLLATQQKKWYHHLQQQV